MGLTIERVALGIDRVDLNLISEQGLNLLDPENPINDKISFLIDKYPGLVHLFEVSSSSLFNRGKVIDKLLLVTSSHGEVHPLTDVQKRKFTKDLDQRWYQLSGASNFGEKSKIKTAPYAITKAMLVHLLWEISNSNDASYSVDPNFNIQDISALLVPDKKGPSQKQLKKIEQFRLSDDEIIEEHFNAALNYFIDEDDLIGLYLQQVRLIETFSDNDDLNKCYKAYEEMCNLEQFLSEAQKAGKEVLLTDDQELLLTQAQKALSLDEKIEIIIEIGRSSYKEVVQRNLRLVVSIAKRYSKGESFKKKFLQNIQAGNYGLLKAVKRYDPKRGFKFSTYATWWIRHEIHASFDSDEIIRKPEKYSRKIRHLQRVIRNLEGELGYSPSILEISEKTGISEYRIEQMLLDAQSVLSLEGSIDPHHHNNDDALRIMDVHPDQAGGPAAITDSKLLEQEIRGILEALPEDEANLLRLRFGFYGKDYTLDEIGEFFGGLSKEAIRLRLIRILNKLRNPIIASRIRDYLDLSS